MHENHADQAAQAFAAALALNPKSGLVLYCRGLTESNSFRPEEAIQDFTAAMAAGFRSSYCYSNRAVEEVALGKWSAAVTDLDQSLRTEGARAYGWILRALVLRRLNLAEPFAEVDEQAARWQGTWPAQIAAFLQGRISEADFMAAAKVPGGAGAEPVNGQLCEAYFYSGMSALFAGNTGAAEVAFQKCLDQAMPSYVETHLAMAELGRLSAR